jgi:imidazolonepropionase-like amidohydrolase
MVAAAAHPSTLRAQTAESSVAFRNVSVIPMDRERIETGRTVLVRGDRIVAIGAAVDVSIPDDAMVVDGGGRFLLPGLTDAHVHIASTPWATAPPDFGVGPLYLASGITTVLNLGGTPTQLEWKRRVEAGELIGPTIYTSGMFINEPRVTTPEDVRREILDQARRGYDLIKFHELDGTTTGLSLLAYRTMIETARDAGLPLVGHAPVNLGLDVMLEAHQALAHVGALSNIYFLPIVSNLRLLALTAAAVAVPMAIAAGWGIAAMLGRRRPTGGRPPEYLSRIQTLTGSVTLAAILAVSCVAMVLPGAPLFESVVLRLVLTAAALFIAAATVLIVALTSRIVRDTSAPTFARVQASAVSIASAALAFVLTMFWVPVSWRSTDNGIDLLAKRVHDAGISVQTTLVVYESLRGPGNDYLRFTQKLTGALHRAGVTIVAGTDALGIPQVVHGTSLHRELELLVESGLTPYEAIRAATVSPAAFMRKDDEFGTVAVGKRADLLLAEANPLRDLSTLRNPAGVMVRGKWLTRERLKQMR